MSEGGLYIEINMGDDNTAPDLLSELKCLRPVEKPEDKPVMITSISKSTGKKKDKKKKKKKSVLDSIIESTDLELEESEESSDNDGGLLDADLALEFQERMVDDDDIIRGKKKQYPKDKKDANSFKKEFADEVRLLYGLLDETNKFGKEIEKDIDKMRGSKVRGTSKYANDLIASAISAKQTKLSIVKEIVSIKKTIADLTIKDSKTKESNSDGNDTDRLASRFFKNILSNRKEYINGITSEEINDNPLRMIEEHGELPMRDEDADKYWSDKLDSAISYSSDVDRTDAGSAYIKYENSNVDIFISKCIDTGEWNLVAIDGDGNELDDYPLPTKRELGTMRFGDDGSYATDSSGRLYTVREYYLEDDDSEEEES